MFENLSDKLQRVFKTLRGEGKLSAANMERVGRRLKPLGRHVLGMQPGLKRTLPKIGYGFEP
jgi:hypothetical protein